jgi:hypothetical protein
MIYFDVSLNRGISLTASDSLGGNFELRRCKLKNDVTVLILHTTGGPYTESLTVFYAQFRN